MTLDIAVHKEGHDDFVGPIPERMIMTWSPAHLVTARSFNCLPTTWSLAYMVMDYLPGRSAMVLSPGHLAMF